MGNWLWSILAKRRDRALDFLLNTADRLSESTSAPVDRPQPSPGSHSPVRIAIVGCGFVADFYTVRLAQHPELELVGVTDQDSARAEKLARRHGAQVYLSLQAMLEDPRVEVVVNLTNPASHFTVTKASLEAGKHVYSEKPLTLVIAQAEELVALARERRLRLSCAPCSVLGGTAQTLAQAVRREEIGRVRVVYAELDDGPIHQMHPEEWASPQGTPWPWRDEFSVGCTLEHAGYYLSWLVALFGPAESVTAFSAGLVPDKHPEMPAGQSAPDFSVGCIRFRCGVVARLTCGIVAPHDHSLRIIGDKGVLTVDECWHNAAPVLIRRFSALRFRAETYPWVARFWLTRTLFGLNGRRYTLSPKAGWRLNLKRHEMDYMLGISELAAALREGRPSRLSAEFALHLTEITLAMQQARETGAFTLIRSTLPKTEWPALSAST